MRVELIALYLTMELVNLCICKPLHDASNHVLACPVLYGEQIAYAAYRATHP